MNELVSTEFDKGVLSFTLRRPESRNALNRALISAIRGAFRKWAEREDVALAVLTGEGDKAFCAGGDLKELMALRESSAAAAFAAETRASLDEIRRFPVPVVAILNGDALGGGAELAVACDMRIAAAHARIGFLQSSLNINTSWGGGTDLFRLVRYSQAVYLLCSAEALDAQRAAQFGLVDMVASPGEEGARLIHAWIARFAARKPQVMRAIKALALLKRAGAPEAEWTRVETEKFAHTWVHDDHWAAVSSMMNRQK